MDRIASVTFAGNFAVIGSCLSLSVGAFFGMEYLFSLENSHRLPSDSTFLPMAIIPIVIALWGIVSGLGIIQFKNWARASILLLAYVFLFCVIPPISAFMVSADSDTSTDPTQHLVKMILIAILLVLAAVGIWWVILFNKKSVKERFRTPVQTDESLASGIINIIAWCIIFNALFWISNDLFQSNGQLVFGICLTGWGAKAWMIGSRIIGICCAVGLLRFRLWARLVAMVYLSVGIANYALAGILLISPLKIGNSILLRAISAGGDQNRFHWLSFIAFVIVVLAEIFCLALNKSTFNDGRVPLKTEVQV